jgi:hypothetical protein
MTFEEIHNEEAGSVGEPDDLSPEELHGVAPPCVECGKRPRENGDLCFECHSETSVEE